MSSLEDLDNIETVALRCDWDSLQDSRVCGAAADPLEGNPRLLSTAFFRALGLQRVPDEDAVFVVETLKARCSTDSIGEGRSGLST